jgi:DNA (cytosine-5)-methyltransferase 3A
MAKEHELVISRYMGVHPIEVNSAKLSAQNRVRLYWTNIANEPYGLFGDMACMIPQPKDRGILLRDVLQSDVDEKYYLSDKALVRIEKAATLGIKAKTDPLKSGTITLKNQSGQLAIDNSTTLIKVDIYGKPKLNQEKASCFTAGGNSGGNHSDMDLIACIKFGRTDEAKQIRKQNMAKGKDHTPFQAKEITDLDFKKMNTLTTATNKDNLVMQLNGSTESGGAQPYQQNRVYDINGISPCLNTDARAHAIQSSDYRIRRLTPTECARLQTIPDWYQWGDTSDTQIYRMLGNGWTIEVIKHIFSYLVYTPN